MKATIEIEDDLFRRTKATAALQGRSLKAYVAAALQEKLVADSAAVQPAETGWRSVFGRAEAAAIGEVTAVVDAEFSRVDLDTWQ